MLSENVQIRDCRGRCPHRPVNCKSILNIPKLTECFGSGSSGGNVLVPARTLRRSRLKGRCRKAAPLSIPRPQRRNCVKMRRPAVGAIPKMPGETKGSLTVSDGRLCVILPPGTNRRSRTRRWSPTCRPRRTPRDGSSRPPGAECRGRTWRHGWLGTEPW